MRAWIDRHFAGNASEFARAIRRPQPHIADILAGRRPIGEKVARAIEHAAKMPERHLDSLPSSLVESRAAYHSIQLTRAGALLGAEWEKLDIDERIDFEQRIHEAVAKKMRAKRKPSSDRPTKEDE